MGVVNVTPDSFSDGGRYLDHRAAVSHARRLVDEGADIVDIGGESTRPGAEPVAADEELARVLPVVTELAAQTDVTISIDTMKARVADEALRAGAHLVNDVSALAGDPGMPEVVRRHEAGAVLMHMRGTPRTMQDDPTYDDVVADVRDYLAERLRRLEATGLSRRQLAIDPGIGFGKTLVHNVTLLRDIAELHECGRPLLVGLSRKRFLGMLTGRDASDRLAGGLAALAHCIVQGVQIMRVHDVKESRDAALVAAALRTERVHGGH